jgi:cellulose synthase/poly-beta-1,6-N-acetylglucosamine synthase-like glycosyltransferase
LIVGNEYDFLLEKRTDDPNTKLLSICIPAYKEDGYLQVTLKYLMSQRMFQNGYVQIVVGEYKDNYSDNTTKNLCESLGSNVKYVHVNKKGISHARNICVWNSVNPIISNDRVVGQYPIPFLMNMDADARFQYDTGSYYMLLPLLENKELMLTNCRIIYPSDIQKKKEKQNKTLAEYIYKMASDLGTASEKVFTARGPGMTFRREAFDRVGGFREDKKVAEDYWFGIDVCYHYTIQAKEFVDNVNIIASDRRVKGANKDGILKAFNYDKAYR